TVARLRPDAALTLPGVDALDALDVRALVAVAEQAAALLAGAQGRLAMMRAVPAAAPRIADYNLTASGVAKILRCDDTKWVYRHARALGGVKLDGLLRFSRRRVDAYIARQARISG